MASKKYYHPHKKFLPTPLEDLLLGWLRRVGGAAVLFFSAVLWLSLLTWSATDPSLSVISSQPPNNALGPLGAALADLLLNTIGLSAVFVLVCCFVWGLQLLFSERVEGFQVRVFFAAVALVGIAGGSSALPTADGWLFHHGYGGIIGDVILNLFVGLLAQFQVSFANTLAGLSLFAFGFWAFSRAIGLDRKHVFLIVRPQSRPQNIKQDQPDRANKKSLTKSAFGAATSAMWGSYGSAASENDESRTTAAEEAEPPSLSPIATPSVEPKAKRNPDPVRAEDDSIMGLKSRLEASVDEASIDHDAKRIAQIFAPENSDQEKQPVQPELPLQQASQPRPRRDRDLPSFLLNEQQDDAEFIVEEDIALVEDYKQPSLEELNEPEPVAVDPQNAVLEHRATAAKLKRVLADFRITGDIADVKKGPMITLFEFVPSAGIKASRVVALADDIARSMSAASARISAMPGRNALAIELPNEQRDTIALKTLFNSEAFQSTDARLPLMLGVDIVGEPVVTDLSRMPHLLVAGTTGSGKSVGINAMILSLLYRKTPQDCKFLMIDPKMLELSAYNGIPHMLAPVVTDPSEAVEALRWAVGEMEERYKRMADLGVRNIESYNKRVAAARNGEAFDVQTGFDPVSRSATFETRFVNLEPMPNIVIVVDEFADLMSVAGKEVEAAMQRLAQMARAAGMHLIMATQRPSVDVITGTLKANFPARLAYRVASKIDSRTILQEQGAEQLLGQGDLLLSLAGQSLMRIHGPMVTEEEIEAVTRSLRSEIGANLGRVAQAA
ncbi:MAG: DNA translocase FtsK 4TM domain-containing protein [Pseudomonadota bacterium]